MTNTDFKIFKMFNKGVESEYLLLEAPKQKKINVSSGEDAFLNMPEDMPVDLEGDCCALN